MWHLFDFPVYIILLFVPKTVNLLFGEGINNYVKEEATYNFKNN